MDWIQVLTIIVSLSAVMYYLVEYVAKDIIIMATGIAVVNITKELQKIYERIDDHAETAEDAHKHFLEDKKRSGR